MTPLPLASTLVTCCWMSMFILTGMVIGCGAGPGWDWPVPMFMTMCMVICIFVWYLLTSPCRNFIRRSAGASLWPARAASGRRARAARQSRKAGKPRRRAMRAAGGVTRLSDRFIFSVIPRWLFPAGCGRSRRRFRRAAGSGVGAARGILGLHAQPRLDVDVAVFDVRRRARIGRRCARALEQDVQGHLPGAHPSGAQVGSAGRAPAGSGREEGELAGDLHLAFERSHRLCGLVRGVAGLIDAGIHERLRGLADTVAQVAAVRLDRQQVALVGGLAGVVAEHAVVEGPGLVDRQR